MPEEAASVLKKLASANRKRTSNSDAAGLVRAVVDAVLAKKAKDVVVVDLRGVSDVADFFVICTGESDLQIKAIVDGVIEDVRESIGERPWRTEGDDARQWVLIDYVNVVVHIFDQEHRSFYNLERLWADAPMEHVEDVPPARKGETK